MEAINFAGLWPKLCELWEYLINLLHGESGTFNTELFSASIVAFLFLVTIGFGIYTTFWGYFRARNRTKKLKGLIKNLTPENLTANRRAIKEQAKSLGYVGDLWGEFDETLVQDQSSDLLHNAMDSSHFFNSHTLAPQLTENRLTAAVPGFLTAIGVIGTFAGLQMGLDGITLSGDVQAQSHDIQKMIASASVAFLTSVWGVLTSVTFNFYEKFLEQLIKKDISSLQDKIDFLFPRISQAQSLVNIAHSTRSSEDALNGLAERIGEQLQQAVSGMGEQVTTGIKEVMQPAMDSLVNASHEFADRQADGAIDALTQIVGGFVGKISQAGEGQKQLMAETTKELKSTIDSWQSQMHQFLEKLESQSTLNAEKEKTLRDALYGQLENFTANMRDSVRKNITASNESTEKNQRLANELSALTKNLSEVMQGFDTCSKRISESSQNMQEAGSEVRSATSVLRNEIRKTLEAVRTLSSENGSMIENTRGIINTINDLKGELAMTATEVTDSSKTVSDSFKEIRTNQDDFLAKQKISLGLFQKEISNDFKTLTEQADGFLKNYTETVEQQTNARLNEWNRQTEEFSGQMVNTVQYLQAILSDLEDNQNNAQ